MTAETQTPPAAPQEKAVVEKQTNCTACSKPIKKLKRFYRNGKFYCSKKCWLKKKLKDKQAKEKPAEAKES